MPFFDSTTRTLQAAGPDARWNEGVEDGLLPQDGKDVWNVGGHRERDRGDQDASKVGVVGQEVAVLLAWQSLKTRASINTARK